MGFRQPTSLPLENTVPITWTSDLDTGIAVIDQQHMRIVDYINQMEHAQQKQDRGLVGRVLDELVDYTLSHFAFEESLQEEAGYPYLKPHRKVHELFVRRVNEYRERFSRGEEIAEEIHTLLSAWLINHIKRDDADYVGAVRPRMVALVSDQRKEGWLARSLGRFFR
ncbi:bacteriohemerythrin [Azoarcus olearius]|nr:hypothetical protein dqs_3909 [Azoarcus olearius]